MWIRYGDEQERAIGFRSSEKARIDRAWSTVCLYEKNGDAEATKAHWFSAILYTLNLLVVCIVVLKQQLYPPVEIDCETGLEDVAHVVRHTASMGFKDSGIEVLEGFKDYLK